MAASDAIPVPRKNTAYRFYFAIRKPSDSTLITTWAGQDSEVSLDGAAYSDCTNEATEIGTSGTGYIDLTASEMNADSVLLKVTVTNTGAVPLVFVLYPESAGDYRVADTQKVDVDTIKTNPVVNGGTVTFPTGATLASTTNITAGTITTATNVTTVNGLAAGVITAASIASDAITAAKIASDVGTEIAGSVWDHVDVGWVSDSYGEIVKGLQTNAALIVADTNELQTDWANGGRLDLIIDAILVDTAEIGAAGAGLTSIPNSAGVTTLLSRLQEQISLTPGGAVTVATNNDKTGYSLTATTGLGNQTANITGNLSGSVGSVTGAVGSVTGAVGSVTGNVGGNVVGSVGSVVGGINTGSGTITTLDALDTAQDSQHSTTQTAIGDVPTANENADALLLRNASNVEATAGEHTLCTVILAMLENSISGTTLTIKRTDGSTTHVTKTLTVDDTADPITGIA